MWQRILGYLSALFPIIWLSSKIVRNKFRYRILKAENISFNFVFQIFPRVNRYIAVESGSVTDSFNYDQAQTECEKIGSGLAIMRNQSDYNALISTVNKSGILLNAYSGVVERDGKVWISGRKSSGSWKWYTREIIPTPWFWTPGQPDATFDACARLRTVTSPFEINDSFCTSYFHKLACE